MRVGLRRTLRIECYHNKMNLQDIGEKTQLQEMIKEQMKLLWTGLRVEMQQQTVEITQNVTTALSKTFEEKLEPLMEENKKLKEEIISLKTKTYFLEKENRKANVIIHGIAEQEKDNNHLMDLVITTLNSMSEKAKIREWDNWEVSKVTRIGRKNENRARPVLVKLILEWRKTEVLKNNKHFPKDVYATDDYPKEVLEKRRELKVKVKEETEKGNIAYIRYDKLIIKDKENNEKRKRQPSTPPADRLAMADINKAPNKVTKTNILQGARSSSLSCPTSGQ